MVKVWGIPSWERFLKEYNRTTVTRTKDGLTPDVTKPVRLVILTKEEYNKLVEYDPNDR